MWAANEITSRQNNKQTSRPKTTAAGARPKTAGARSKRPKTAGARTRKHVRKPKKKYDGPKRYYAPFVRILPKILISVGLFFTFLGVIILAIGVTESMNYPTGEQKLVENCTKLTS